MAVGVELGVGQLGLADARGRGAEDQRDARRAMAPARRGHRLEEAVGLQAEPGQPVVAAVPAREGLGQADLFEAVDAADPVGSGAGPKSLARRPLRECSSASASGSLPTPTAEVAV